MSSAGRHDAIVETSGCAIPTPRHLTAETPDWSAAADRFLLDVVGRSKSIEVLERPT